MLTSHVSSITFLISILTLMLFLIPYFTLWHTFIKLGFISVKYDFIFFFFIFLCYAGFLLGDWLSAMNKKSGVVEQPSIFETIDIKKFETYSIIIGVIGFLGYGFFIYQSGPLYFIGHGSGDISVGGYVYELRYFIFSAVLLLFNLFISKRLSIKGKVFLIFFVVFLCFDAYVQQQRGSWIRFGVILIFSYLFTQKKQDKLKISLLFSKYKAIFISGIFFAFLLTLTVHIRKFYSPNTSLVQQVGLTIDHISQHPDLLFGGSAVDEGNEFVTAYNAFHANEIAGTSDLGLKWLYPFLNFIPRTLWADKPTWIKFSTNIFTMMLRYSNIKPAPGSAETGYIDTFYRFLWLSPLFFIAFGYYTRNLHTEAKRDLNKRMFYICLYVGCFYFITQNMMPMIIFTFYMYIPIWFVNRKCIMSNYTSHE